MLVTGVRVVTLLTVERWLYIAQLLILPQAFKF